MMIEVDDDFTDEITVANLAQSYVSIQDNLKNGNDWHEDDVAAWKEILPAIMTLLNWYSLDAKAEIKKARKKRK